MTVLVETAGVAAAPGNSAPAAVPRLQLCLMASQPPFCLGQEVNEHTSRKVFSKHVGSKGRIRRLCCSELNGTWSKASGGHSRKPFAR
mmetsp:Transcript_88476/g.184901  ORF Transcript_88476/g.184901 Transcript_88476/m.184901 type:complete len:88 (+) Transcript_88476:608-871(+)